MFKHILIPTDGSGVAAKAIRAGVRLATSATPSSWPRTGIAASRAWSSAA